MYRSRLVRTFLGVSRPRTERHPSAFTGFDAADDMPFERVREIGRPLHVVNTTLNLVADAKLSVAERKATSFTMSPLHAGSRAARLSAGGDATRPASSSGEALTTSGAAISSNMGAECVARDDVSADRVQCPAGRLARQPWCRRRRTWMRAAPAFGVAPLVNELLARTTNTNPYVLLSDGGHFENLGLYEMVLRRCRYIVLSDAGCDGTYAFGDLGECGAANPHRFRHRHRVPRRAPHRSVAPDGTGDGHAVTGRFAVGIIRYKAIDPGLKNGVLLYLKPTVIGDEPVDVANYARTHASFPHESTTEQWFDEAQFESYRMLGLQTVAAVSGGEPFATVREFCLSAQQGQL